MATNITKKRGEHRLTLGHTRRWGQQHSTMRKPGIPPARIPEITWRKPKGITTHSWSLWSKQRQRRVATRVVKRRVKRIVKPELTWEKQMWNGQWNSPAGALRVRSVVLFRSSYSWAISCAQLLRCLPDRYSAKDIWLVATRMRERWEISYKDISHGTIIAVAVGSSTLVLLQVVFMVWKIMLIISAWWYLCIKLFRWRACPFGCMWQKQ